MTRRPPIVLSRYMAMSLKKHVKPVRGIFFIIKRNALHFLTSETKSIWSNVCRTFWAQSPRIYELQSNGDNQENHKEILNQTGRGTFKKIFKSFKA